MEQQIKNEKAKVRELVSFVSFSCDHRKQQIQFGICYMYGIKNLRYIHTLKVFE